MTRQPLHWRSHLPMKPAVCLGGFHRVGQFANYLTDVVANGAFECPDVKAGKAVRDSR
jgi:hypothetical protein